MDDISAHQQTANVVCSQKLVRMHSITINVPIIKPKSGGHN